MFLDIAIGIYIAAFLGWVFRFSPSTWFFIGGILIAVLPDSDFLYFLSKRHKGRDRVHDYEHRDFIHYPLICLSLGTVVFYLVAGKEWAVLFFLCLLFHFIHDSIAFGFGIKWLWPFLKKNFAFFYLYSRKEKRGLRKFIFSFDKNSLKHFVGEHGDKDWFRNIYYRLHPIAIVEFVVFISSIIFLLFYISK